jgi:hypothetical protein
LIHYSIFGKIRKKEEDSIAMEQYIVYDPSLTQPDRLVLQVLEDDVRREPQTRAGSTTCQNDGNGQVSADHLRSPNSSTRELQTTPATRSLGAAESLVIETVDILESWNNTNSEHFEPTVASSIDHHHTLEWSKLSRHLLQYYIGLVQPLVRFKTDVVMMTHLLLYFSTSVPSAILLFRNFNIYHGMMHLVMQLAYIGPYTLMMHQHIHMGGVLHKRLSLFDNLFPYILDPLMGHVWHSYYYHHCKHHHVEGNGPDDLSSTIRYQRDNVFHFMRYVARFSILGWIELPWYFLQKRRNKLAAKVTFWQTANCLMLYCLYKINKHAAIFVFLLPLFVFRVGVMFGNWGQHAFVDHDDPDSDYRSSITLIDVPVSSSIPSWLWPFIFPNSNNWVKRAIDIRSMMVITLLII